MKRKMKIKLKDNGTWRAPTCDELQGISLTDFMCDSFDPMVIALYEEDEAKVIISNRDSILETYGEKGLATLHSDVLNVLLGENEYVGNVLRTFPEAEFVEVISKGDI